MKQAPAKILLVDDDDQLSEILALTLEAEGYEVACRGDAAGALDATTTEEYALILLDIRLGNESGLELLPLLRERDPNAQLLMITAHGDVDSAVTAFKAGASGYLRKPFEEGHLKTQVAQAVETYRLKAELRALKQDRGSMDVREIFKSRDPMMEPTLKRIGMAANVLSNVVIHGESGTGKELVARSLHLCGPRRSGPFVAINCAALPETLLESELFGHVRGAFTDARENKAGLFVRAHGGTLFLDEIGDAPLSIQSKLLRVLQEREVLPLGGKAPIKVDVRIVAASHKSLAEEVTKGTFRRDLYYRLQVIPIAIPPLRDRPKDIVYLASIFAMKLSNELGVPFDGFSPTAIDAMESYDWPGNVRELQNRVEHALVIGQGGWLSAQNVFPERALSEQELQLDALAASAPGAESPEETSLEDAAAELLPFKEAKHSFEKSYLHRILSEAKGNIAKAARLAVKSRTELYGLVRKHGLDPDAFKERQG